MHSKSGLSLSDINMRLNLGKICKQTIDNKCAHKEIMHTLDEIISCWTSWMTSSLFSITLLTTQKAIQAKIRQITNTKVTSIHSRLSNVAFISMVASANLPVRPLQLVFVNVHRVSLMLDCLYNKVQVYRFWIAFCSTI